MHTCTKEITDEIAFKYVFIRLLVYIAFKSMIASGIKYLAPTVKGCKSLLFYR